MLLSVFAMNFSSSARLHGHQVLNLQKRYQQAALLESGLARGRHEYRKYRDNRGLLDKQDEIQTLSGEPLDLWFPRYEPYNATINGTTVAIRLINESGKININEADLQLLQDILAACGVEIGTRRTAIANSILDWRDKDGLSRAEGAEKDYYLAQSDRYLPKNMDLEAVQELLLIKGVSHELYEGSDHTAGLKDFFTVVGQGSKLDINCASPKTFTIIPEFPVDVVQRIISRRQEKPLSDMNELSQVVPQRYFSQLKKYYAVSRPRFLRIEAGVVHESGKTGRVSSRIFNLGG
jgi:general secretion pathway protein K